MRKRQGNNPKRRIIPKDEVAPGVLKRYANRVKYTGSSLHKRNAADYGFHPPANPRPDKSLCDGGRIVKRAEAKALFREGIRRGMISGRLTREFPKHVWAVDPDGRVYEAIHGRDGDYHGYELGDDDPMKEMILREWSSRCPAS